MSGTTPDVVGSISETAASTLALELTVSGITPQVAVSVAGSEDADSTFAAGADGTVAK